MPARRTQAWRARALAVATGLLAAALLLEAGVRVFDVGPTFHVVYRETVRASEDPDLGYELSPLARDGDDRISSSGLRDGEHPLAKPAGVFRIAAVGDSVTYGLGVSREEAWPDVLERLLNDRAGDAGPRFEVLNLGVPGYCVGQVVARLRGLGIAHQPDLVVYGYVLNDPQTESVQGEAIERLRAEADAHFQRPGEAALLRALAHSRLFLLVRHALEQPIERAPARPGPDPAVAAHRRHALDDYVRALHADPDTASLFRRGLDDLRDTAADRGFPVVLAIFPLLLEGEDDPADVHALVAREAAVRGLGVVDLRTPFARAAARLGRSPRIDFLHPDAAGHRVAAGAVLGALCAGDLLPESVDCGSAPRQPPGQPAASAGAPAERSGS